MDRGGGAGEVIYLIDLEKDRLGHVVADKLEFFIVEQVRDISFPSGKEIVEADDLITFIKKPLAEVRADKSGAAGYKYAHKISIENERLRLF
jgi:hypothetical protein